MSDAGQVQSYPTRSLAEVASRITDGSHFSPVPQEQGHLIANVKDMKSGQIDFDGCTRISTTAFRELKATGCVIKRNNVLLSKDGTVGRVVVYDSDQEIGALSSICLITPQVGQDPRFLGHALQGHDCVRQYENAMSGSALRRLVLRDIRQIRVPAPEVEEQAKIANVLDALDASIRQTGAIVEKLKLVKQGLLHDLMTRGIDANGELRPPQGQAPNLYKDSPLGWIPKEWALVPIASLASEVTSGARDWARLYADSGATFVRIGNLTREHINFRLESLVFVRPPVAGEGQRTKLQAGDILISITADLGIIGVVPKTLGEAYISQHIAMVRVDQERANPRFLGHLLSGHAAQRHIAHLNDSGAKAGLNLPTIRGLPVAAPTQSEQEFIAQQLDSVDLRIAAAKVELSKTAMLKSGLMDDLLTGRVRVTPLLT